MVELFVLCPLKHTFCIVQVKAKVTELMIGEQNFVRYPNAVKEAQQAAVIPSQNDNDRLL
jgi:hypothetical protein